MFNEMAEEGKERRSVGAKMNHGDGNPIIDGVAESSERAATVNDLRVPELLLGIRNDATKWFESFSFRF